MSMSPCSSRARGNFTQNGNMYSRRRPRNKQKNIFSSSKYIVTGLSGGFVCYEVTISSFGVGTALLNNR